MTNAFLYWIYGQYVSVSAAYTEVIAEFSFVFSSMYPKRHLQKFNAPDFCIQILSFAAGYLDEGRAPGSPLKGPTERMFINLGVRLQLITYYSTANHTTQHNTKPNYNIFQSIPFHIILYHTTSQPATLPQRKLLHQLFVFLLQQANVGPRGSRGKTGERVRSL